MKDLTERLRDGFRMLNDDEDLEDQNIDAAPGRGVALPPQTKEHREEKARYYRKIREG